MSATPTFYILHGDDSISRDAALARMRKAMGEDGDLNRSEFDGTRTPVADVLAAVKSLPFLADKRLVIVKGLVSHISRKGAGKTGRAAADRLIEELPGLPAFARLVFYETEPLDEGNKLLNAVKEMDNGYIRYYGAPEHLRDWLRARAREHGTEISPRAAAAISDLLSYDEHSRNSRSRRADRRREGKQARALAILSADNELSKLADFVNGRAPISEEDVAALTPYVPEANIFEMVDALATGDGSRALELIHQSLHQNPGDAGFGLFGMIARQFRLLLMTRDHLDRGGGAQGATIAKVVGTSPYAAGKLATQSRRFNAKQLDAILKRLQRYDQDMKTGRIEPRLALELLVTSLARA